MAQDYDKIIKENLQESIPDFIETFLHIPVPATEDVPLELQRTLERRPDFLKKVRFGNPSSDFILQVEAQSSDEEMRFRFIVYKGVLLEREKCPVVQAVLYFGEKTPSMLTEYMDSTMSCRFHLINFKEIPYERLLNMGKPGEVIFALLGDLKGKNPELVVDEIIERLVNMTTGELQLKKYAVQLRVISKLRNLQSVVSKIINRMPIVFDIREDILYKQGQQEGLEKGIEKGLEKGLEKGQLKANYVFVINLIREGSFSASQMARISNTSDAFVKKVQRELKLESEVKAMLKPRTKNETIARKLGLTPEFVESIRQLQKKNSKS